MDSTTGPAEVNLSSRTQDPSTNFSQPLGGKSSDTITPGSALTPAGLCSPVCFRIRGIPTEWDSTCLMRFLTNKDKELDENTAKLSGPFPSPVTNEQCALLNLDNCTTYLCTKFSDPNAEADFFGERFHVIIDRHFFDLTPMNRPSLPIIADVIAITGMGGHAFGSWRSRRRTPRPSQRPMWIHDFLPGRFPNTRIMTYGYNCSLVRPNEARMMDYRQNFEDALLNARRDCKDRQIIFIGHSLGALLIIQLLIEWSNDPARHCLRDCIRGIFLFGAPHQGMEASDLYNLVEEDTDGRKCAAMLAQLQEGSEFLEQQQRSLARVSEYFNGRIYSFFETCKIQMVGPRIDSGAAGYVERVSRHSAQLYLPRERRVQVDSNHTDMVKLSSAEDHVFQTIVTGIKFCLASDNTEVIRSCLWQALDRQIDGYNSVDQPGRIGDPIEIDDLKNSEEYFWLFHNPDYKVWCEGGGGYKLLCVGRKEGLSPIASYHARVMRNTRSYYSSLCCLYGSLPTSKNAHMVWILLRQAIHACSQEQQGMILREFFKSLVSSMMENVQVELAARPAVTPRTILEASSPERLWCALGDSIRNVVEYRSKAEHPPRQGLKILGIIIDINSIPMTEYQEAIEGIRRLGRQMQQMFDVVKVLAVNVPASKDAIILQRSEYVILHGVYMEEREACLRSLAFQNTRYERISPHQEHTTDWLWQTNEYLSWNTDRRAAPGLLLIEGKPGSGKSTLLRYIKENIGPSSRYTVVSSFFYSARGGREERSHFNMLKVVLHRILEADKNVFVYFQTFHRRIRDDIRRHWTLGDLQKITEKIFNVHPLPSIIYCILDAMDESDNTNRNRIEILQHFDKLLNASQRNETGPLLKIVLGSRPINELADNLSEAICRISLQEKTRMDIKKYTTARLDEKIFWRCDKDLRDEFEDYILATADGVFLWVRLVIDELEQRVRNGSRVKDLLALLKSLPKDLKSFYEHIFEELKGGIDGRDLTDGGRILGFCLLSHRAIELGELCDALALLDIKEGDEPDPLGWVQGRCVDIRSFVTHCVGGLVDIKGGRNGPAVAQLMHQTVREFLTNPPEGLIGTPFDITNLTKVSLMISLTCVRCLEIMYEEMTPGGRGDPLCPKYLEERPLLKYSLEHLMTNLGSRDAKIEARLKSLVGKLENDKESNAYMILGRLIEPKRPAEILKRLEPLLLDAARYGHAMAIANLLAVGADKDCQGQAGGTYGRLLNHAAGGGHESAVKVLLAGGASRGEKDYLTDTPMGCAVKGDHVGTIDLLYNHGVGLYNHRLSLLGVAAATGRIVATRKLLKLERDQGEVAFNEDDRMIALHYACLGGCDDIFTELNQPDINLWEKDGAGLDALSYDIIGGNRTTIEKILGLVGSLAQMDYDGYIKLASLYGNSSVVELLEMRKAGATEPRDKSGRVAESLYIGDPEKSDIGKLHIAAAYDHYPIFYWLRERGIELDTRDQNGYSALHVAAQNDCADSCEELVMLGSNHKLRDRSGAAPMHLAVASKPQDTRTINMLDFLTCYMFPVDNNGETPLHYAAKYGLLEVCQYILGDYKPDPRAYLDAADNNGKTPLHYAAEAGSIGVCEFLLKDGNDPVKTVDQNKSTPLHFAAMKGHLDVCTLLLRKKADRCAVDRNGLTPSDVAVNAGFGDLASMLSPDADLSSVSGSGGSDPSCMESDKNLEGPSPLIPEPALEEGALAAFDLPNEGNCLQIGLEPLGERSETSIPDRPRFNSDLVGELTSVMPPDDDQETIVSPAPCKRPALRGESPDHLTEGVNPKRARNDGGRIQVPTGLRLGSFEIEYRDG